MAISDIFRRNPVKNIDRKKLKDAEFTLKLRSKELLGEVRQIKNEIQLLFGKSKKENSRLGEISLANRIKTLNQKRDMKASAQFRTEKELTAVSNLLIIKEHEADLKAAGVWDPLQKLPAEKLEDYLTKMQLDQQEDEDQVKIITEITSSAFRTSVDEEEGLEDILKVMDALKEGELEPEAAKEIITKKEETEE